VLLIGLAITGAAVILAVRVNNRHSQQEVRSESEVARTAIERQLTFYADLLYGMKGQFSIDPGTTRDEFVTYLEATLAFERQPGIQALEYSRRVRPEEIEEFEAAVRSDDSLVVGGYPDFGIHPAGAEQDLYVVDYVEPYAGNEAAFGFDLGSNPARRLAVEKARDSARPVATEAIQLVQGTQPRVAFLLLLAVYDGGITPAGLEERRESFAGVVNGVFLMDIVLADVLGPQPQVDVYIFDASAAEEIGDLADYLLYSSNLEGDGAAALRDPGAESLDMVIGGRRWTMVAQPNEHLNIGATAWLARIVLVGGFLLSAMTAGLTYILITAEHRASARAEAATTHLEEQAVELRQARDRAEDADRAKTGFLSKMSHELRTPLTAVIGFSSILRRRTAGDLSSKQMHYATQIGTSGEHLLSLINDLLDLSKVEAGREDLDLTVLNVAELLSSAVDLTREQAVAANVDLRSSDVSTGLTMIGDSRRMRQILVNLLDNGVTFTPPGGAVSIDADRKGDIVEFVVRDTGVGIASDDLELIFTPFHQGRNRRDIPRQGTGLGLPIVKGLVELHGGTITVESTPGVGSQFTVTIPTAAIGTEPADVELEATDGDRSPQVGSGTTILIADADQIIRGLLVDILEEVGFETRTAATGVEAVEAVATSKPDLVLMDLDMPEMDGIEAIRRIRARLDATDLPIIALTAAARDGDRERCMAAGSDAYVTKPFDPVELIEVVMNHLGAR